MFDGGFSRSSSFVAKVSLLVGAKLPLARL